MVERIIDNNAGHFSHGFDSCGQLLLAFAVDRRIFVVGLLDDRDPSRRITAEDVDRHVNLFFKFVLVLFCPWLHHARCLELFTEVKFSLFGSATAHLTLN